MVEIQRAPGGPSADDALNGLQLQLAYTYSECTDIESGSWGQDAGTIYENSFNHNQDRGYCAYQVRHNLTANGLYVLPFRGNRLAEGWQIGSIFTIHTGVPINVTDGFVYAWQNGSTANRPNYNPNGSVVVNHQTINCNNDPVFSNPMNNPMTQAEGLGSGNTWFVNPACYSLPPVGELGNLGRESLIGPGTIQLDTSLTKMTRINERLNVQFRAEFFNILNNVNFANPGAAIFTQGAITQTSVAGNVGSPRAADGDTDDLAPDPVWAEIPVLMMNHSRAPRQRCAPLIVSCRFF